MPAQSIVSMTAQSEAMEAQSIKMMTQSAKQAGLQGASEDARTGGHRARLSAPAGRQSVYPLLASRQNVPKFHEEESHYSSIPGMQYPMWRKKSFASLLPVFLVAAKPLHRGLL